MLVTSWLLASGVAGAASLHVDDFQAGVAGWTGGTFGGQTITRVTAGGPAGAGDAFLRLQVASSNLATHNSLSAWTGDYASTGAAAVSVDLRNETGSDPLAMRLVLFGPNSTSVRWTSASPVDVPADGVWRRYEFSLAEAALSLVQGNANYNALMDGVFRVMLRHDPGAASSGGAGVSATLGVDNVQLQGAPILGDYTGDGAVDQADYDLWAGAYGFEGESSADANGDGRVDAADYTLWRDALQPTPRAIPEPSAAALLIAPTVGCGARTRRRVLS